MYKKEKWLYHLMLTPGILAVLMFNTVTLLGIFVAFQDFVPNRGWFGSEWVSLENFALFFGTPDAWIVIRNTLVMAVGTIVFSTLASIAFALLLNEVRSGGIKRVVQTFVYLPHFVSWVIYASIIRFLLSGDGMLNRLLLSLGMEEPILFLSKENLFQPVMILTEVMKEFGYGSIIYLTAIANVNPNFYEAATLDGANRWQKMYYITLPCIMPTIILMATLSVGNVLNAGFDQVFNLYSPAVYSTADIIDTYVYRIGLLNINYGLGSAIGLFKSVISMLLIVVSYSLAAKFCDYRIF